MPPPPLPDNRASAEMLEHQNHVLELIARSAPLDETLTVYLRAIEAQAPDMLSSILLLDSDGLHLRHCAAPTLPTEYVKAIDGKPIGPASGSCGTAAFLCAPAGPRRSSTGGSASSVPSQCTSARRASPLPSIGR